MKKVVVTIALIAVALVAVAVFLPFVLLFAGILVAPDPPLPDVTYGEFPFRLEYAVDGEIAVIRDTLLCEYDGVGANAGEGKYVKWAGHFASGRERIVLLQIDETSEILYELGSPRYYMGYYPLHSQLRRTPVTAIRVESRNMLVTSLIKAEELRETYGIQLISWDLPEPIVNSPGPGF